jgi:hypothetical protein
MRFFRSLAWVYAAVAMAALIWALIIDVSMRHSGTVRSSFAALGAHQTFWTPMTYAINIRSDNESSRPLEALWERCGALEGSPSMEALHYPPHISLAIYDDIDPTELCGVLDSACIGLNAAAIRFAKLGYFEAPQAIILWASPEMPEQLLSAHAHVHSKIGAERSRPHYRPGKWMPHCSLALAVPLGNRRRALALVDEEIEPFEVVFDTADCASFMPVKVLYEKALVSA